MDYESVDSYAGFREKAYDCPRTLLHTRSYLTFSQPVFLHGKARLATSEQQS